ncbi:hypothetical protein HMPREF3189_01017 [Clostridiales bacterium KA00134]|nr:hypothetical protein HMPREF3189_01017 [Clostridiales bacterium KA00134]
MHEGLSPFIQNLLKPSFNKNKILKTNKTPKSEVRILGFFIKEHIIKTSFNRIKVYILKIRIY